ncbi:hypothetical protein BRD06_02390 [Halobacteriales archaeon QS_9_67_15]|nr:MAG: hypothetical protein BRD06_02390 [Halobacteriales archaeon QS_9_67_15]
MTDTGRQLRALYFTRFAGSFGFVALLTLLPTFINELGAEGFVLELFATGLALALVGDLARESERANTIGTANAWRFAAAIGGTFAFTGVFGFLGILSDSHGRDALAAW